MSITSSTLATSFLLVKSSPAGDNSRSPASARVRTVPRAAAPPSSSSSSLSSSNELDRGWYINRITQSLKTLTKAAILVGAVASITARPFPARAWTPAPVAVSEPHKKRVDKWMAEFIEQPGSLDKIRYAVELEVQGGKHERALELLDWMTELQPSADEWIVCKARFLRCIGRTEDARKVFEEILARDPTSFEASFEHDLLLHSCGEGEAVIRRLQEALVKEEDTDAKETLDVAVEEGQVKESRDVEEEDAAKEALAKEEDTAAEETLDVAVEEGRVKESRDVRLIKAQIQFLQNNVEGALASYQELTNEDPADFRPYFCRGMICLSLDRYEESGKELCKAFALTQKLFDVGNGMRTLC